MSVQAVTLDSVVDSLKALSVSTANVFSHATTSSPDTWKEALSTSVTSVTGNFHYTKTLVFKPKTAKQAKPVPVIVVAKLETDTNTGALGKEIGQKDLRLASPELLTEFLGATKDDGECNIEPGRRATSS
jgi:prolyl-tRNA synthetase